LRTVFERFASGTRHGHRDRAGRATSAATRPRPARSAPMALATHARTRHSIRDFTIIVNLMTCKTSGSELARFVRTVCGRSL